MGIMALPSVDLKPMPAAASLYNSRPT